MIIAVSPVGDESEIVINVQLPVSMQPVGAAFGGPLLLKTYIFYNADGESPSLQCSIQVIDDITGARKAPLHEASK